MSDALAEIRFGGTVAGDVIDAIDWSASSLGPIPSWPRILRSMVATLLHSRQPMFLWWGPELIQFYNDAYLPSFGFGKHPAAMGQRGADCWGEIWPIIWPQIEDVMQRKQASWNEDALVPIFRNGKLEEVYWTYGYSPVIDENGQVAATLVVCTETTAAVLLMRRAECVRRLANACMTAETVHGVAEAALGVAASSAADLPFALRYRFDSASGRDVLADVRGVAAEQVERLDAAVGAHLAAASNAAGTARLNLEHLPDDVPLTAGTWPEPPSHVVSVRPRLAALGTWVFGLGSRLPFDAAYRQFVGDFVEQMELAAERIESARARAAIESERRNLLLQAPFASALVVGLELRYELANDAYRRMVGRDVVGKTYAEAFPEVVGTPLYDLVESVARSGEPFSVEEYRVPLDRSGSGVLEDCYFKFHLEPIRDGNGAVYGMMVVAVDVTELVASRRALEAANRAKDAFLATVSHELRTPLSAILGWARMLRSGGLPQNRAAHALEVIERNALAQTQLIEDLLDVSRIIAGKLRLEVASFALTPVLEAAVESIQHALSAKELRFELSVEPSAGSIQGDGHRLQQVIWNLLSNAVKFTPKGGSIRLHVERASESVLITVSDSGQGLATEILPSIFERFKQADGSARRVHGGLGLGLAITRHIVELHGGTIEASSEGVGRGAKFVVRLPATTTASDSETPAPGAVVPSQRELVPPPKELQGLTVLVVDDDADARDVLAETIQHLGCAVLTAASASEALAMLDHASPRVLVTDIGMPEMDGYDLIAAIRKRKADEGRDIVAIALTAFASADDRRRALAAGFQLHLAKPVEPTALVAALAELTELTPTVH